MNEIIENMKDAVNQTTELLQIYINNQQTQPEQNKLSTIIIEIITSLTNISIATQKEYNLYNDRHSKLCKCLVDMKTLVQSQKRKILVLENNPEMVHIATNTDFEHQDFHTQNLNLVADTLMYNMISMKNEKLLKKVEILENRINDQAYTIQSLRTKLKQSSNLLKAQQVLIDSSSYIEPDISFHMKYDNIKNSDKTNLISTSYKEESALKRPPLIPNTSYPRLRVNKPIENNEFIEHEDSNDNNNDEANHSHHSDLCSSENYKQSEYYKKDCNIEIEEYKNANDFTYSTNSSMDDDYSNIKEPDTIPYHYSSVYSYSQHNSEDYKVFEDTSGCPHDNVAIVDSTSLIVHKSFEIDNPLNSSISDEVELNETSENNRSSWNIDNVNDSFVLVQDFYDSRFSY